jgi:hypothetical protein
MHVLLIILGLLLLLFGGGCTVIFVGLGLQDPSSMLGDMALLLQLWLPLGLAPLIGGFFLFRHGLKLKRERSKTRMQPPNPAEKGDST